MAGEARIDQIRRFLEPEVGHLSLLLVGIPDGVIPEANGRVPIEVREAQMKVAANHLTAIGWSPDTSPATQPQQIVG